MNIDEQQRSIYVVDSIKIDANARNVDTDASTHIAVYVAREQQTQIQQQQTAKNSSSDNAHTI